MKKLTLGLAVFFCGGSSVMAADMMTSDAWYVSPSVNWAKADTGFGVGKRDVGAGVRFGKALSPNVDIQLGPTYVSIKDTNVHYQQFTFGVDALYLFSRGNFRPLVLAGVGGEYDKKDAPGVNTTKTSPYIDAGLGFQYAFNDKIALQTDYRRVHGFLRGNNFGFNRSDNDYLTVGVNIGFGGAH
ncbi:MAG: outer membrane beta-barrel protein [Burkholderiaceae bacterium]